MTTQKTFKRGVRTRMAKTGESYAAARTQLVRKADARAADRSATVPSSKAVPEGFEPPTSDEAARKGTGRGWAEWFALLDAWGASARRHPEIARWLVNEHGISGWWSQGVTVAYERARGLRVTHQVAAGFSIGATRTIAASTDQVLRAFTDPRTRARWLPDAALRRRPTRAATAARFDWPEPPSRVSVIVDASGEGKARVALQHEKLPDAEAAIHFKQLWRQRLTDLKALLEGT